MANKVAQGERRIVAPLRGPGSHSMILVSLTTAPPSKERRRRARRSGGNSARKLGLLRLYFAAGVLPGSLTASKV